MKILCYLILVVAFLMYYQQNPMVMLIILLAVVGVYLVSKRRRAASRGYYAGPRRGIFGFGKGAAYGVPPPAQDINTFIALSQYLDNDVEEVLHQFPGSEREEQLDAVKEDLINLLED